VFDPQEHLEAGESPLKDFNLLLGNWLTDFSDELQPYLKGGRIVADVVLKSIARWVHQRGSVHRWGWCRATHGCEWSIERAASGDA